MKLVWILVASVVVVSQAAGQGLMGPDTSSRLIGGTEISDKRRYPYMVLMEGRSRTGLFAETTTHCAGTLIAPRWVLSAAHCYSGNSAVEDASKWHASVGTLHPYDWVHRFLLHPVGFLFRKPEWQSWRLHVDRIFKHPSFINQGMYDNDIALLKLRDEAPVGRHPYVGVLGLPAANDKSLPEPQTHCTVTGWGCTEDGGTVTDQEVEMTLPILSRSQCTGYYPRMTQNQFCAGLSNGGKSACEGDSGGPMACMNGTTRFLAGIISFASESDRERYPSGFLYVAPYVDWINQIMSSN